MMPGPEALRWIALVSLLWTSFEEGPKSLFPGAILTAAMVGMWLQ